MAAGAGPDEEARTLRFAREVVPAVTIGWPGLGVASGRLAFPVVVEGGGAGLELEFALLVFALEVGGLDAIRCLGVSACCACCVVCRGQSYFRLVPEWSMSAIELLSLSDTGLSACFIAFTWAFFSPGFSLGRSPFFSDFAPFKLTISFFSC